VTSFAKGTSVPVSRSKGEIEDLLTKWKATRIGVMTEPGKAFVMFAIGKWSVQFEMPLPTEASAKTQKTSQGWLMTETQRQKWLEQTTREKWRALVLTIKAKLVSVENGVESFEEAFLAHLVLASGATVGQKALPALREKAAASQPLMLGAGGAA
jgi:hypothetical protein